MTRSTDYFNTVYDLLGVTLTDADLAGESTYNHELTNICDELEAAGLARISDGALCVFLEGFTGRDGKLVPLIVRKSDGGYGYATTDLTTVRHRVRDLGADRMLYVIGAPKACTSRWFSLPPARPGGSRRASRSFTSRSATCSDWTARSSRPAVVPP